MPKHPSRSLRHRLAGQSRLELQRRASQENVLLLGLRQSNTIVLSKHIYLLQILERDETADEHRGETQGKPVEVFVYQPQRSFAE